MIVGWDELTAKLVSEFTCFNGDWEHHDLLVRLF